jgi:hypothetical protein
MERENKRSLKVNLIDYSRLYDDVLKTLININKNYKIKRMLAFDPKSISKVFDLVPSMKPSSFFFKKK